MEAAKQQRAPRPREDTAEDELRVTNQGRIATYVSYAARLLRDEGKNTLTVRASGLAIPTAVSTVEVLKRRIKGLHQQSTIGITQLVENIEAGEKGSETQQTRIRMVPFFVVTLTRNETEIDTRQYGYQPPLDESLIKELRELSGEGRPPRRGRGRRGGMRGGRGGFGAPTQGIETGTGEPAPRRGRGGRFRGRGGRRGRGRGRRSEVPATSTTQNSPTVETAAAPAAAGPMVAAN